MKRPQSKAKRRRITLATVGLVVEGDTEFLAFPLLYKKKLVANCPPLKPTNLKGVGSHLSLSGIVKRIAPKVLAHLVAGRTKVVVCLDLEDRNECPGEFAGRIQTALVKQLREKGQLCDSVSVVILNRAFETILIAAASSLHRKKLLKRTLAEHCFEGRIGKERRKGVVELTEMLGRDYDKTTDGPRLFERIDIGEARRHGGSEQGSKSFDKLLRVLGV